MGLSFVALTSAAVAGVGKADAGIASALLNAGQQVGGALGLAILTAVSTARTDVAVPRPAAGPAGRPAVLRRARVGLVGRLRRRRLLPRRRRRLALLLVRVTKEDAVAALKEAVPA